MLSKIITALSGATGVPLAVRSSCPDENAPEKKLCTTCRARVLVHRDVRTCPVCSIPQALVANDPSIFSVEEAHVGFLAKGEKEEEVVLKPKSFPPIYICEEEKCRFMFSSGQGTTCPHCESVNTHETEVRLEKHT